MAKLDDEFWEKQSGILAGRIRPLITDAALAGAEGGEAMLREALPNDTLPPASDVEDNLKKWAGGMAVIIALLMIKTSRNLLVNILLAEGIVLTADGSVQTALGAVAVMTVLRGAIDAITAKHRSELTAVNEVTRAFAMGNLVYWDRSSRVEGYSVHTMEDGKVCPVCNAISSGSPYPMSDEEHMPPFHGKCRCWLGLVLSMSVGR